MRWQSLCTSRHRGSGFGWVCRHAAPKSPAQKSSYGCSWPAQQIPSSAALLSVALEGFTKRKEEEGTGPWRALQSLKEGEGLCGAHFFCVPITAQGTEPPGQPLPSGSAPQAVGSLPPGSGGGWEAPRGDLPVRAAGSMNISQLSLGLAAADGWGYNFA